MGLVSRLLSRIGILTFTELCDTLRDGRLAEAKAILTKRPDFAARTDRYGASPLSLAAHLGDVSLVEQLVALGADVHSRGAGGMTPLHEVAWDGWGIFEGIPRDEATRAQMADILLARGADPNAEADGGATPLFIAAASGLAAVVEVLLAHGANANGGPTEDMTPLRVAEENGYTHMATILRQFGAAGPGEH